MVKLPCLGQAGAALFQITADSAFNLISEDIFLRRHTPVTMQRDDRHFTEQQLLDQLLRPPILGDRLSTSNRIYFLYGAPGSGKSELSKWLEIMLNRHAPARPVIRVTKDELNTIDVLDRLQKSMGNAGFSAEVTNRWADFRDRTRLLANYLVNKALLGVLRGDPPPKLVEVLVEAVHQQVAIMLERMKRGDTGEDWVPQLITPEQFEAIRNVSVAGERPEWDVATLHAALVSAWHAEVHGGKIDWPNVLRQFADRLSDGIRPVLIIDDVMRALNIFAVELLDAFVDSFDNGKWDVVIGVTPGALEKTYQGKQLLETLESRTFADRITHLRLTNESGRESYFVQEENSPAFLARYMAEYKDLNGFRCGEDCSHYHKCVTVADFEAEGIRLVPFTPSLVRRVYGSIPAEQGRARALVRKTGDILEQWADHGIDPEVLTQRKVLSNFYADLAPDQEGLRPYAELFGPVPQDNHLSLSPGFWEFFGLSGPNQVSVRALGSAGSRILGPSQGSGQPVLPIQTTKDLPGDNEHEINRWLNRQTDNTKLLQPLRVGVLKLVQRVIEPQVLSRDNVLTGKGALTYRETFQETMPPVRLDGADSPGHGVRIATAIRGRAFEFASYGQTPNPTDAERLLAVPELVPSLYSAYELQEHYRLETKKQLNGHTLAGFALDLMALLVSLHGPAPPTPVILTKAIPCIRLPKRDFPRDLSHVRPELNPDIRDAIVQFFKDTYLLRADLFDGNLLDEELQQLGTVHDLLMRLDKLDPVRISDHLYLGPNKASSQKLRVVIAHIKDKVIKPLRSLTANKELLEVLTRFKQAAEQIPTVTPETFLSWQNILRPAAKVQPFFAARIATIAGYTIAKFSEHRQQALELLETGKSLLSISGEPENPLAWANFLFLMRELEANPLFTLVRDTASLLNDMRLSIHKELATQESGLGKTGVLALRDDLFSLAIFGQAVEYQVRPVPSGQEGLRAYLEQMGYLVMKSEPGCLMAQTPDGVGLAVVYTTGRHKPLTAGGVTSVLDQYLDHLEKGNRLVIWSENTLDSGIDDVLARRYRGQVTVLGIDSWGGNKVRVHDNAGDALTVRLAGLHLAQVGQTWNIVYARSVKFDTARPPLPHAPDLTAALNQVRALLHESSQVEIRAQALKKLASACDSTPLSTAMWVVALHGVLSGGASPSVNSLVEDVLDTCTLLNRLRLSSSEQLLRETSQKIEDLFSAFEDAAEQAKCYNLLEKYQNRLKEMSAMVQWDIFAPLLPLSRPDLTWALDQLSSLSYRKPSKSLAFAERWGKIAERLSIDSTEHSNGLTRLRTFFDLTENEAKLLDAAFFSRKGLPLSELDAQVVDKLEKKLPGISKVMVVIAPTGKN